MLHLPIPYKPHRMARARGAITHDSTHIPQISLFNNATDGSWLAVLGITGDGSVGTQSVSSYQQGSLGALAMNGVPIMTNIALLPGQVFTNQTLLVRPAGDFEVLAVVAGNILWIPSEAPFALISPGWSLVMSGTSLTADTVWSFFWQVWRDYEVVQWNDRDL